MYTQDAHLWQEHKRRIAEQINHKGLPLVLFGQSPAVKRDFFKEIQVEMKYLFDNNQTKWGNTCYDLEIISPNQCPYEQYQVLILVPFVDEITAQLQALPCPPVDIMYLDLYFEQENSAEYFSSHQKEIESIINHLADEESKRVFEQVIRYRINRDPALLEQIARPRKTQYFPQQLGGKPFLHDHESFVDAGAFVGDTVETFIQTVHGSFASIHAFEPDSKNFKQLFAQCAPYETAYCYQAGVGESSGTAHFSSDASNSCLDEQGSQSVFIVTLDRELEGQSVTYLKMDVEGMECSALQGAKKLIAEQKPKLAICTYHSDQDMLEVPQLILQLNPTYQLYFRHYTKGIVETVCYAI